MNDCHQREQDRSSGSDGLHMVYPLGWGSDVRVSFSHRADGRAPQVVVLVPRQADHDDVHGRDQEQPYRMREVEAVQLVEDKEPEDGDGDRVVHQLGSQQANDQPELDDAVAQKVERGQVARAHRKVLGRLEKVVGDPVAPIFEQLRQV